MSLQVETLGNNMAKLTIEVPAQELDKAIQAVYTRNRGRINLPGFRKGKAPRAMIERMYGTGIFLDDAVNDLLPVEYSKALQECDLEIVSQPKVDLVQAEPGKALIFTAEVATKPDVELGQYKGVEVVRMDTTVTDEDIDNEIRREQEKNSRTITVEDRGAQTGDTVTMDYVGTIDGTAFEGGSGTDQRLELGSGTFIPGFEEQLVGVVAGDHRDVEVSFPDDYQSKDLAGKAAVFACEIKKVETKELPELDDEFAQDVSEFNTMAEYRKDLKLTLKIRKENQAKTALENAAVEKAIGNAKIDIPEPMILLQAENMLDDYARSMQMQGISMDQYLSYSGQSRDSLLESMKPNAADQIRTRLTLEKIAEVEDIQVTDEELDEELEKMAKSYSMEVDKLRENMKDRLDDMRKDIAVQKAITLIADAAVGVDAPEESQPAQAE